MSPLFGDTHVNSNRHNRIDYIEFGVANRNALSGATNFYRTAFGWNYQYWGDDYVDTRDSGVASGINADADHRPAKPLVVIYTYPLEQTRADVIKSGGQITKDIFSFPGGRRFHFVDPAGCELAVWTDR